MHPLITAPELVVGMIRTGHGQFKRSFEQHAAARLNRLRCRKAMMELAPASTSRRQVALWMPTRSAQWFSHNMDGWAVLP